MAECALIHDARCVPVLDLLESKRAPDGGLPAERKHYSVVLSSQKRCRSGQTLVGWGPVCPKRKTTNDSVTVEALAVLAAADRL